MAGLICFFRPCNWMHLFNAHHPKGLGGVRVYQCSRCKTITGQQEGE